MIPTKYQKSTLYAYNTTAQTVLSGNPIAVTTIGEKSGCSISFNAAGSVISLTKPGLYYIDVDAVVTDGSADGTVIMNILKNGAAIPGATASHYIEEATDLFTLSTGAIISVPPSCCAVDNTANLTIVNASVAAQYTNVNVKVFKLC